MEDVKSQGKDLPVRNLSQFRSIASCIHLTASRISAV